MGDPGLVGPCPARNGMRLCGHSSVVAPGQSGLGRGKEPRDDTGDPSWWHGERSESGGVSDGSVLCTTAFET